MLPLVRPKLTAIKCRVLGRRLPRVMVVRSLDREGIRFEAGVRAELYSLVYLGWEPEFIRAMLEQLEPDDVFFDVGANLGLVALHAARHCRVLAFEPDPYFRSRLERNIELNPELSVEVHQVAVGDADGRVTLFRDHEGATSASLVRQREEPEAVEVPSRKLSSMVADGSAPAPTVVKLDIEGAEILALRGARDLLHGAAAPRALFLEIHSSFLRGFDSSAEEVAELLGEAGYTDAVYDEVRDDQRHLIVRKEPA